MIIFYKNSTSHPIKLSLYSNGLNRIIVIDSFSSVNAVIADVTDSVLIFNENTLNAIHYSQYQNKTKLNPKVFLATDSGSLYNPNSYTNTITQLTCGGSLTESTYTFN